MWIFEDSGSAGWKSRDLNADDECYLNTKGERKATEI